VNWKRIETSPESTDGVYFLGTSKTELSETGIWDIYNTLTRIEETFRILKTDMSHRPGFHRSDIQSEAHIYPGVVAYLVVMTIRHQLKASGIHHDWRNIIRLMNAQKMVLSSAKDSKGQQ
jgi:transposase